jgi:hypothetical protein
MHAHTQQSPAGANPGIRFFQRQRAGNVVRVELCEVQQALRGRK